MQNLLYTFRLSFQNHNISSNLHWSCMRVGIFPHICLCDTISFILCERTRSKRGSFGTSPVFSQGQCVHLHVSSSLYAGQWKRLMSSESTWETYCQGRTQICIFLETTLGGIPFFYLQLNVLPSFHTDYIWQSEYVHINFNIQFTWQFCWNIKCKM